MMLSWTPHDDSEVPSEPERAGMSKEERKKADDEQSWTGLGPRSLELHPKAFLVIGGHKHWLAHEDVEHGHERGRWKGLGTRSFVMHKRHCSTWRVTGSSEVSITSFSSAFRSCKHGTLELLGAYVSYPDQPSCQIGKHFSLVITSPMIMT